MIIFLCFIACQQKTSSQPDTPVEPVKQEAPADNSNPAAKPAGHEHSARGQPTMNSSASVDPGPIPENAKVFFKSPESGTTVKSPVRFEMMVEGMTVQPAGELRDGTGHHHILVDAKVVTKGAPIPADSQHIHFGKGQTSTELELSSGEHTLQLQFANGAHLSYGPQLSSTITIIVE